jgi:hypothetical protein
VSAAPLEASATPALIGYFPKRTVRRPDWLRAAGVEEVCSVSTCVSRGPGDWIQRWRHNALWVYDSPALAWSIVPEGSRHELDLYAYRMYPVEWVAGTPRPLAMPALPDLEPLDASFERLGHDVVSRSAGTSFECSPLSCNSLAREHAVNRHCLIEDAAGALRLAGEIERRGGEPGPYCVVEVWRPRRAAA